MKPIHEMTARQYHEHVINTVSKQSRITREAAHYMHRRSETDRKHLEYLEAACRQGIELRREVLDSLYPPYRTHILKHYPNLHRDYILPEARALARGKSDLYTVDPYERQQAYEQMKAAYEELYEIENKRFRNARIQRTDGRYRFALVYAR